MGDLPIIDKLSNWLSPSQPWYIWLGVANGLAALGFSVLLLSLGSFTIAGLGGLLCLGAFVFLGIMSFAVGGGMRQPVSGGPFGGVIMSDEEIKDHIRDLNTGRPQARSERFRSASLMALSMLLFGVVLVLVG